MRRLGVQLAHSASWYSGLSKDTKMTAKLPTAARIVTFLLKREPSAGNAETHSLFDAMKDAPESCNSIEFWSIAADTALDEAFEANRRGERSFVLRAQEAMRGADGINTSREVGSILLKRAQSLTA